MCDIIRVKRSASCGKVKYSSSVHILRSPWSSQRYIEDRFLYKYTDNSLQVPKGQDISKANQLVQKGKNLFNYEKAKILNLLRNKNKLYISAGERWNAGVASLIEVHLDDLSYIFLHFQVPFFSRYQFM